MLPEGQDPDDLVRSGGAPAIAEALRAAEPLAELLFAPRDGGPRLRHAGKARRPRAAAARTHRPDRRRHAAPPLRGRHGAPARRFLRRRRARRAAGGGAARALPARRRTVWPSGSWAAARPRRRRAAGRAAPPGRRAPRGAARNRHSGDPCLPSRAARKARRGGGGDRIPQSGARRLPRPASRPAGGGLRRAEALASALRRRGSPPSANASCRRPPARPIGGASVLGRKSRTPNTFCAKLWPCNGVPGR